MCGARLPMELVPLASVFFSNGNCSLIYQCDTSVIRLDGHISRWIFDYSMV